MFDSTPMKIRPADDRNAFMNEDLLGRLAKYRGAALDSDAPARRPATSRDTVRTLDLIALWDDNVSVLVASIDMIADWGPFELVDAAPLSVGADGRRRVLCRFVYHGSRGERSQFEHCLRTGLAQITRWEEPPVSASRELADAETRP